MDSASTSIHPLLPSGQRWMDSGQSQGHAVHQEDMTVDLKASRELSKRCPSASTEDYLMHTSAPFSMLFTEAEEKRPCPTQALKIRLVTKKNQHSQQTTNARRVEA